MKKTTLICFALLFCYWAQGQNCQEILFILDDSGSVSSGERADMTASVQALADAIELINPSVLIGVVQFSSSTSSGPPHYVIETTFVNDPIIQNNSTSSSSDYFPASIAQMEVDGLFSPGGLFFETDGIFMFTDGYISQGTSYLSGNGIPVSNPACSPGWEEYSDLSASLGDVPISIYRVGSNGGSANGMQQGDGILLEGNSNFLVSDSQIDEFISSLDCAEVFALETDCNVCSDGIDNDGDGFIDIDDIDCQNFLDTTSMSFIPNEIYFQSNFGESLIETSTICDTLSFSFQRECPADSIYVQLKFEGSADLIDDFIVSDLIETFVIPPGTNGLEFNLEIIDDLIDEPIEDLQIILCTSLDSTEVFTPQDTLSLSIFDQYPIQLAASDVNYDCSDESIFLMANTVITALDVTYMWYDDTGMFVGSGSVIEIPSTDVSVFYTVIAVDFCGSIEETMIFVNDISPPEPSVVITADSNNVCPGQPLELSSTITDGLQNFNYDWSNGGNLNSTTYNVPIGITEPIIVNLEVTDLCGRSAQNEIELFPAVPPTATLLSESICFGDVIELRTDIFTGTGIAPFSYEYFYQDTGTPLDFSFYDQETGDATLANLSEGTYLFEVEVTDKCTQYDADYLAIDSIQVEVIDCDIPNVFSPDGDGFNDEFYVQSLDGRSGFLYIYNRWGQEIHRTNSSKWDGADYSEGTYFYVVVYNDGGTGKSGHLTLLR